MRRFFRKRWVAALLAVVVCARAATCSDTDPTTARSLAADLILTSVRLAEKGATSVLSVDFASARGNFTVEAHPTQNLISDDARLEQDFGNGTIRSGKLGSGSLRRHHLEGQIVGEDDSPAVFLFRNNRLSGSVVRHGEVFTIEDSVLVRRNDRSPDGSSFVPVHQVIYSDQDIDRGEMAGMCRSQRDLWDRPFSAEVTAGDPPEKAFHLAGKRCPLRLVADHTYFRLVGQSNLQQTIDKMITQIQRVNQIFLQTKFVNEDGEGFTDMGFLVRDVKVLKDATPTADGRMHFNMEGDISAEDILRSFAEEETEENRWHCLAHLFTARSFEEGVLGRAFLGHAAAERGVCAKPVTPANSTDGRRIVQNVGVTTSLIMGTLLLSRISDITVAHELAHGWGAEHDPDTPECLPPDSAGGAYIMNAHPNSGRNSHNRLLSPCSIRQIRMTLKFKSFCFVAPQALDLCGNFVLDSGEECDVGPIRNDSCCTNGCRLRSDAACSDFNHACCDHCQFARAGRVCRARLRAECFADSFCSGNSEHCPPQKPLPDNVTCSDRGTCRSGVCIPYCEAIGLESCLCDGVDACNRCCRQADSNECSPILPLDRLADGTLCSVGYCKAGRCKKRVQDVVSRLVNIIKKVSPSWIFSRLKRYAVPLVILGLSVIWVPFGLVMHFYDKSFYAVPVDRTPVAVLRHGSTSFLNRVDRISAYIGDYDVEPRPGSRPAVKTSDL